MLVSTEAVPRSGTFYSLTVNQPPLPYLPLVARGLPVFALPDGSLVYDDRAVDYNLVLAESLVMAAAEASLSGGESMLSLSAVPSPPGGGGGAGGGPTTNPPPYSVPGLKLTIPTITNGVVFTSVFEADTNSAYDLFEQLALAPGAPWTRIAGTEIGGTNFAVSMLPPNLANAAFYRAADTTDSDFDGLPDAVESLQLGLNPLATDSDGDGVPDGSELATNGVPHAVNYQALTYAVIFSSRATAYEGGQSGEWTVLLPSPAPTGGEALTLHLGGYTDWGYDYLLSANGVAVTNSVVVPAGQRQVTIQVQAVNNDVQETRSRRVQASLVAATHFECDSTLAEVTIMDNDLPTLSIIPLDRQGQEQPLLAGTNLATFLIIREGAMDTTIPVYMVRSGSATTDVDYDLYEGTPGDSHRLPFEPVYLYPGSNSQVVLIRPLPDTAYEGSETVTLTLWQPAVEGLARVNPASASATVTLLDDDLPIVSLEGTDLVATEYNLKSATVTVRRTGTTIAPMTVPLAFGGTAQWDVDYQAVTNNSGMGGSIIFAPGVSAVTLNVKPLADGIEEPAERIQVTLKGGKDYAIGASNSVTVLLDDDSPTRFQVLRTKPSAAHDRINSQSPFLTSAAVYDVRRFGRSATATNVPFGFYTNSSTGLRRAFSLTVTGDLDATQTNLVFTPWSTTARLGATPPSSQLTGTAFSALFHTINGSYYSFSVRPIAEIVSLRLTQTNSIEGTSTQAVVRLERSSSFPAAVSLSLAVGGGATVAGQVLADHNLPALITLTIPANGTFAQTNLVAPIDSLFEGWESVTLNPIQSPTGPCLEPARPLMAFIRENTFDLSNLPETDLDLDGLGDHWELVNGLDPFAPGESGLDPDLDGLSNLDEYQSSTNPQLADTDGDGIKDYAEIHQPPDLGTEYVPVRLRVFDTGKVNNGENCAVCHTTKLKVGDYSHFSSTRGEAAEKTFHFRKGASYPIWLGELAQNLPPVTNSANTPTTTGKYNASVITPDTNTPAAFVVVDPNNKLGTNQPWSNFPANPNQPVATLIVPKIDVSWETRPGNVALDANPKVGGGMRIYPDATSPTDSVSGRDRVKVRIKTTPPVPLQTVRLRWLDVDDPIDWADDYQFIIDSNDRGGFRGNDNRGNPDAVSLTQTQLLLDSQGEAVTEFIVSLQPGDNFRVAAALDGPGAVNHLNQLQVTDLVTPFYVTPDQEQVEGFIGALSPLLTVWRKLHLEFDSMVAPPTSGPEALYEPVVLFRVTPNRPIAGHSQVTLIWTNGLEGYNHYERGKLEITGAGGYRTLNSRTTRVPGGRMFTEVELDAVLATNTVGLPAKLYDDDDQYLTNDPLYPSNLGLQSPPLPALNQIGAFLQAAQPKYAAAYITLVDANAMGWNTQPNIAFKRYVAPYTTAGTILDNGNLQLKGTDRAEFWAFSVVFAYQPTTVFGFFGIGPVIEVAFFDDGDWDGETPLSGSTRENPVTGTPEPYSAVFLEAIRDYEFGRRGNSPPQPTEFVHPIRAPSLANQYIQRVYAVLAHELGHAPGRRSGTDDHNEGGILDSGAPQSLAGDQFRPASIARFRGVTSWTQ